MNRVIYLKISFFLLSSALVFGCASGIENVCRDSDASSRNKACVVPDWLKSSVPKYAGKICAVGESGPTYYKEDAIKNAGEAARANLATGLSANIEQITLVVNTESSETVDKAYAVQATTSTTEYVLTNSEIKDVWADEFGLSDGNKKGYTYALACIQGASPEIPPKKESK